MKYVVVGLGNIGRKRRALLGSRCVATVDPYNHLADFASASDCPLESYDAAILAVPNQSKLELLEFFLQHGKQVLLEKPLLLPDCATATRLNRLAGAHRAIWYTSYNHRFEPMIQVLKEHLLEQATGRVYYARLFYGNGTVGNVAGTWRDSGQGVLEDLGSHLLDLAGELFNCRGDAFPVGTVQRHEAASPDHAIFASRDGRFTLEVSLVCWKNTFTIDVYGERGSLHLNGLAKWGPSTLIFNKRSYPSGIPTALAFAEQGPDLTWQRDLEYFERACDSGRTSVDNDWWISRVLQQQQSVEVAA